MSSVFLKLGSLVIKTLSKPIANQIKARAREHEAFRRRCISIAQFVHRWDMRLRLGLLQDHAAIDKQSAREAAEFQARKHKHEAPTVKTEAQAKADELAASTTKEKGSEKVKAPSAPKPYIRPLTEAKAIDSGANFVSESFLLMVGVGLIVFENWRRSEKETSRREDVAEKLRELEGGEKASRRALVELEKEILRLRGEKGSPPAKRILPKEVWELEEKEEQADEKQPRGWMSWIRASIQRNPSHEGSDTNGNQPGQEANMKQVVSTNGSSGSNNPLTGKTLGRGKIVWPFSSSKESTQSLTEPTSNANLTANQESPTHPTTKTS